MTLTKALNTKPTCHIADPEKLTLCGRPSTPVLFRSAAQVRLSRPYRLCRACEKALEAIERKEVL